MRFRSEHERMQHPQASLIPKALWDKRNFFNRNLSEHELILIQTDAQDLMNHVQSLAPQLENTREKQCAWLAIAFSHPELSPEQLRQISNLLTMSETDLFKAAIAWGNPPFFETLINEHSNAGRLQAMIVADNYGAFRAAASGGHLDVLNHIWEFTPEGTRQAMIATYDYEAFRNAAFSGHLEVLNRVWELTPEGARQAMIAANNYEAFRWAASVGHLDILNRIWELTPSDNARQAMIAANDYEAFRNAASGGHLEVLNRIWELTSEGTRQDMIAAYHYGAFRNAAFSGHLKALNRILELTSEGTRQAMIASYDYEAFRSAASGGHLDILNRIWQLTPEGACQAMIASYDYEAFGMAASRGHLEVINRIWELTSEDARQDMIAAYHYGAFRNAASGGHLPVVNRLLQFTSVFAYAEMHEGEYGELHVHPFVTNKLSALRTDKNAVEADNPDAVFDIAGAEEAKLCFYMLRNLIRRNDPALLDNIRFLLEIPAVKTLAHTAVTPRAPNELLRLALTIGNRDAAELLDTIPAIHDLAVQNNYYHTEARGGINLAALAQDHESSMRALSTGEQQRLQAALDRYQPMIKQAGVPNIMAGLRQTLETRYTEKPAILIRDDGSELALPLSWNDFKRLELTDYENKRALEAYYQHKDHSAWRYLSKPNPWMHERAAYVYISEDHRDRWSTFEEYQPLISMLYLAVQDKEITPIDGYTLETRLDHFIDELALIGRAHNWDDTRVKMDSEGTILLNEDGHVITEEFDNLEGDRPSCYSGVKRRLFQSVQGHPLLKMLTKETVDEEIRDFVRQHFSQMINEGNRTELEQAWDTCIKGDEMNEGDWSILKKFDIAPDQQQAFIKSLADKYGAQFTGERAFIAQVKEKFSLKGNPDAHVLNLGYVGIRQLLEPRASSANTGFFTPAGQAQKNETNEEASQHKPTRN